MRIYLSYNQFQAIRKSVIISDLVLIVLTAIAFYYSFFVEVYHFFIFAVACFLVKLVANLFIEKEYRFPSYIHLIAPFPIFTVFFVIWIISLIFISDIFNVNNFKFANLIFGLIIVFVVVLFFLIKHISLNKIDYYRFTPSYRLYSYYMLMSRILGKNINMLCLILQISCFYSIDFSIVFAVFANGIHPVEEFVFFGLFAPLLFFAFFNFIEIMFFLFAKFPKSEQFFEDEIKGSFKFLIIVIFACFLGFLMANMPYWNKSYVKSYLGSQYEPTMEKLIEQKRNGK